MKEKYSSNFLIGFIIGTLICIVAWYWYKSTSAEDGALDMLDRLAESDARLQAERTRADAARARLVLDPAATAVSTPATPKVTKKAKAEDLTQIKGVGPVFAKRLQAAGIHTVADVAALTSERLADLLDIGSKRAETIRDEARKQ